MSMDTPSNWSEAITRMSEDRPSCALCHYYLGDKLRGACRRHSPVRIPKWPQVEATDWCGEYAPRRKAEQGS